MMILIRLAWSLAFRPLSLCGARLLLCHGKIVVSIARFPTVLACGLLGLCLSGPVLAQGTKSAAEHDEQARAYFRTGAYVQAAEEFQKAHAIENKPTRLYNAALAYENAGDKRKASEFFARYLEAEPSGAKAIESRARKAALDQAIADMDKEAAAVAARQARADEAARRQRAAREFARTGDYDAASAALAEAYQADQQPVLLFERAEMQRLAGKKLDAMASYRQYLAEDPEGPYSTEAKGKVAAIEAATVLSRTAASASPPPKSSLSTLSVLGLGTAGLGLVSVGTSAFFALRASRLEAELMGLDPSSGDAWNREQDAAFQEGQSAANLSLGFAIAGGGLLVGGVVMYFVGKREDSESGAALTLVPTLTTKGGGLVVSGPF